jgi:hypothetical protein
VLAAFLDGELDRAEWRLDDGTASHLERCAACRGELDRGRRLDALLAARGAARPVLPPDLAARLLQPALAVTQQPATTARRGRLLLPLAVVAGAAAGFAASLSLRGVPVRPIVAPARADVQSRLGEPGHPILLLQSGGGGAPPGRVSSPLPQGLASLVRMLSADLGNAWTCHALARARVWGLPPGRARAAALECAATARLSAARVLVGSSQWVAVSALAAAVADERDPASARRLAAMARKTDGFVERLARALGDEVPEPHAVAAAAILGGAALDRALLELARREPAASAAIARACARHEDRPRATEFLLDLWREVEHAAARDVEGIDTQADRAPTWFAALPAQATDDLLRQLRVSRNSDRRHRSLLALEVRADARAAGALIDTALGPRRDDALLAAYALGAIRSADVTRRLHELARGSRRPDLFWAALARQGDAGARAAIRTLPLSAEEREFLGAAQFLPEQMALAASLFRRRR